MTVLITLTTAGLDAGPFDLYSNIDGYFATFETGVSRSALLAGYTSTLVPDFTTIVRVRSTGVCTNYIDVPILGITTTTSTTEGGVYQFPMTRFPVNTQLEACADIATGEPLVFISTRYATSSYLSPGMTVYEDEALTIPISWTEPKYYGYFKNPGTVLAWAYIDGNGVVLSSGYCQ